MTRKIEVGPVRRITGETTTFAALWQARADFREDMRRDPGYVNENVVPVDADMAQAMQAWAESILWAGEDVA